MVIVGYRPDWVPESHWTGNLPQAVQCAGPAYARRDFPDARLNPPARVHDADVTVLRPMDMYLAKRPMVGGGGAGR
jgi:hypothetical protein